MHIDDGRALGDILLTIDLTAIGMPGDGNDNAGLTWDGTYLYLVNMYDNNLYVIDPMGPMIVNNLPLLPLSWGLGHEQNPWATENITGYCYEIGGPGNFLCGSWMADISENWQDGELWILSVGGSNKAYKFTVPGGVCIDSIGDPAWTYTSQRGFTYDPWNDKFFVGGWNSNMVWEINTDGTPTGRQFSFNNVASLAYDYQSTIHPAPVLWIATNEAVNQIYMVDPDNPPPEIVWDFETGWQGWTHTNGLTFPAAWDVQPSGYRPAWTPPNAGNSCMWIDDDTGSSTQDTALSPVLLPGATTEWLKYGVGYRHLGSQFMDVGIKYYDGVSWTAVPLKTYNSNFGPAWDSVDISAYNTYQNIQIYFYFDDAGGWNWWAAFDNVMIKGDTTGIAEVPKTDEPLVFGFAPDMPTVTKHPTIVYTTTIPGKVSLKVYDSSGRLIRTFVNNREPAGTKTVYWDGKDVALRTVPNGVYFVGLRTEEKRATRKIVLIR
ncbi:T9SS type A sorting domain-containing protein [candidate division WOR-3 bacterium]|nr:T9SS type A sorting domain-containing protein [candidate division WOR-3 bacterium]